MTNTLKKTHHCDICKKSFTSTYKLKSHLFYHKAVAARFKCSFCLKEYYRKDQFNHHVLTHENRQKLHFCDHCGRGFVDKRSLVKHLNIHDDLFVPSKRYNCAACDVSYCEERLLQYHIRKHHMNLEVNIPIHTTKKLNESWIEPSMDAANCVQITKIKNNMMSIKKCEIKTKKENVKSGAKHFTKFASKTAKEDTDKIAFEHYLASAFAMKDNLYSKAICEYCKKEMLKKSLIVHIREKHSAKRRFQCDECMRSFNRPYHLSSHNCGRVRKTKKNQIRN